MGGRRKKTDLSGITTDVSIVKDGDGSIINALSGKTKTINGVTYNNYSRFDGVTASAKEYEIQVSSGKFIW